MNLGAPGISAAFLNAVEAVFQQNAGGTESGHYVLAGLIPAAGGGVISCYVVSLSRTTVPVSVAFDTLDTPPTGGMGTVNTGSLTAGGFQVWCTNSTLNSSNARAGGNWTIQY